jgi:hypothetical protein
MKHTMMFMGAALLPVGAAVAQVCVEPTPIIQTVANLTLTGDQGYTRFYRTGLPANYVIDASTAVFHPANSKNANPTATYPCSSGSLPTNPVPVLIENSGNGLIWNGGNFAGQVPITTEWKATYCDSSSFRIMNTPNPTIRNVRMDRVWDGFRIRQSDNFVLQNIRMTNVRDDAIENDFQHNANISNVLIDGTLTCLALAPPSGSGAIDGRNNTVTMDRFYCRLATYNQEGVMTAGTPIKADTDYAITNDRNPQLRFSNCAIAVPSGKHMGLSRMQRAWLKTKSVTNCYYLNLSDTPFSSTYPKPPAGFTVLQGAPARAKWEELKAAWYAANPSLR